MDRETVIRLMKELDFPAFYEHGYDLMHRFATALNELIAEHTRIIKEEFERECNDVDWLLNRLGFAGDNFRTDGGSLRLQMLVELFERFMSERMKTQKEYYESVFKDGANRIEELTSELQSTRLQMITDFGQYQEAHDKVKELTAEVERLKLLEDSALKVCSQLDEIVLAMPYDYLDPPDGGNVSMAEQVGRMYSEVKQLRHQNAELTAEVERLKLCKGHLATDREYWRERSNELDAELEHFRKNAKPSFDRQMRDQNTIAELTAQRDAAMKDAERYRWLRSEHALNDPIAAVVWKRNYDRKESEWVNTSDVHSLDRAIDAAIANCK